MATKIYGHNDLAGCVQQRTCRATGTLVGVYHSEQSGMESDPESPWSSVCEVHHTLICSTTLALARSAASWPDWCDECQPLLYPDES